MGEEKPAEFYDGIKYMKPHIYERYKVIYEAAADLLPHSDICPTIVDLGCGVGWFAKLVYDRGYIDYIGVDFSLAMILYARENAKKFHFIVSDLFAPDMADIYRKEQLFVLLEVLEHVTEDKKLLKMLPPGARLILSLPSYDAKSHVRKFKSEQEIRNRYDKYINIKSIKVIPWKGPNVVFIVDGVRR